MDKKPGIQANYHNSEPEPPCRNVCYWTLQEKNMSVSLSDGMLEMRTADSENTYLSFEILRNAQRMDS